jgi:hypothetical protein
VGTADSAWPGSKDQRPAGGSGVAWDQSVLELGNEEQKHGTEMRTTGERTSGVSNRGSRTRFAGDGGRLERVFGFENAVNADQTLSLVHAH